MRWIEKANQEGWHDCHAEGETEGHKSMYFTNQYSSVGQIRRNNVVGIKIFYSMSHQQLLHMEKISGRCPQDYHESHCKFDLIFGKRRENLVSLDFGVPFATRMK